MSNYVVRCPRCRSDASDIGMFGSYFDIYKCSECATEYCYLCRNSNNGRRCPECEDSDGHHRAVARVAKG